MSDTATERRTTVIASRIERPYLPSYFLPGRIESKVVQFLVDTGCTTNLISKHVFDRLPTDVKERLQESDTHGVMADGTQLPFYGIIKLPFRLRDLKTEEAFVVSKLSEDAILGMPFLSKHQCTMAFGKPMLQINGHELKCTDKHGHLLVNPVQVVRPSKVPPLSEMMVECRVSSHNACPMGMMEGTFEAYYWQQA